MSVVEILSTHRAFDGTLHYCRHQSAATGTPMRFTIFLPPGEGPFPVMVWLSGLTCTEDNFTVKAGAYGAELRQDRLQKTIMLKCVSYMHSALCRQNAIFLLELAL